MIRPLSLCGLLPILVIGLTSCGGGSDADAKPKAVVPKKAAAPSGGSGGEVKLEYSTVVGLFGPDGPGKAMRERVKNKKEQVALGRMLYEDKRLSKGKDISCATCHDLDNWGQDGKKTSPGTGGAAGKRNSPTTFNAYRQFAQFWDYRAQSVEEQATMPMLTSHEHGLKDEAEIESILAGIPEYAEPFKAAFPNDEKPITAANVRLAIGAFERELETRSRFDDYLDGDQSALTNEEKKGLQAFIALTCTTCHIGRLVGGTLPQKLGLYKPVEFDDKGVFELEKVPGTEYMFKVPQLLNVEKTAPYYHDGSIATLEEAVKHMSEYQVPPGMKVTDAQLDSIVAFLKALTGKPPKILSK